MRTHWIWLFFLLMSAAVGCSSAPITTGDSSELPTLEAQISPSKEPADTINPSLPTEGVPTQMFQAMKAPLSNEMQALIDKAKEHLAERLSIAMDQVNFVGVYDVTWPDTSLGCPQKGMMYAQVLTPGFLIQLEYGTIQYEYHSGKSMQQVVTCENPGQPLPGNPDSY